MAEDHHSTEEWAREAELSLTKARERRLEGKRWEWVGPTVGLAIVLLFVAAFALAIIIAIRGGAL